jgi:AcrR family transcriptional regulator
METTTPKEKHPLLLRAVPAAEQLIREEHFSLENLCRALSCSLRELAEAVGSVDELMLHVNERFMAAFVERAEGVDAESGADDLQVLQALILAWLDHAQTHPQQLKVLLQHRWSPGFERPEWYMQRVASCFAAIERRLRKLAPGATPQSIGAASRAMYAMSCGLFFLSANERSTPVGIASQQKLLAVAVAWLAEGLAQE